MNKNILLSEYGFCSYLPTFDIGKQCFTNSSIPTELTKVHKVDIGLLNKPLEAFTLAELFLVILFEEDIRFFNILVHLRNRTPGIKVDTIVVHVFKNLSELLGVLKEFKPAQFVGLKVSNFYLLFFGLWIKNKFRM